MTPAEIRAARRNLGMTHRQFGHALGVQEQTARRWEIAAGKTSHRKPSPQTVMLLRQMLAGQSGQGVGDGVQTGGVGL
jgi:DNA-binding transcriptional regulator YiaG